MFPVEEAFHESRIATQQTAGDLRRIWKYKGIHTLPPVLVSPSKAQLESWTFCRVTVSQRASFGRANDTLCAQNANIVLMSLGVIVRLRARRSFVPSATLAIPSHGGLAPRTDHESSVTSSKRSRDVHSSTRGVLDGSQSLPVSL